MCGCVLSRKLYTSHLFAAPWSRVSIRFYLIKEKKYILSAVFCLLLGTFSVRNGPYKVMWSQIYRLFRFNLLGSHGPLQRYIVKNGWVYEGGKWQARSHLNPPKGWGGKSNYNPLPIIQLKKFLTTPGPPPSSTSFSYRDGLSIGFMGMRSVLFCVRSGRKKIPWYLKTAKK